MVLVVDDVVVVVGTPREASEQSASDVATAPFATKAPASSHCDLLASASNEIATTAVRTAGRSTDGAAPGRRAMTDVGRLGFPGELLGNFR